MNQPSTYQRPSLAIIAGFGGINSAGRSSAHHAFNRVIYDVLSRQQQTRTRQALAELMSLDADNDSEAILAGTLIRQWDNVSWDPEAVPFHQPFEDDDGNACLRIQHKRLAVQSAGQLPKGFDPATRYPARHHPRGLQMTVYGASDAIASLGVEWSVLRQHVRPDQIAVYAGSAMGQLDTCGHGGMLQAALAGKRVTSKQCALGLSEMPADFINAYVLGSVGATGSSVGACATFLYNLKTALDDLRSGRRRVVIVGNAEAPLTPEIVEGYHAMTALVSEQKLRELDQIDTTAAVEFRRASRPFGENAGFTLSESAQFFVLTDSALALELGLTVHGSVGDVFVHADGYKKSISNPGVGNYLTMAKAMAEAKRWLGDEALTSGSYVHAHGSSTPQNRVTESHIYQQLADTFDINRWRITAIKAHLGHPLSTASADQLTMALGSWHSDIIPGITTTKALAADVYRKKLHYVLQHETMNAEQTPLCFINSKGFGGNNASAFVISPQKTQQIMKDDVGVQNWHQYLDRNQQVRETSQNYDNNTLAGKSEPIYQFGNDLLEPQDLQFSPEEIRINGWQHGIPL